MPPDPEHQPVSFERAGPDGVEADAKALAEDAARVQERAARGPEAEAAALEAEISSLEARVKELYRTGELPVAEAALVDDATLAVDKAFNAGVIIKWGELILPKAPRAVGLRRLDKPAPETLLLLLPLWELTLRPRLFLFPPSNPDLAYPPWPDSRGSNLIL